MLRSGAHVFTDIDQYEAALPTGVDLWPMVPSGFRATLTWVKLPHLSLLHAREAVPRLASVVLPARHITVIFPTHRMSSLICDGRRLEFGDVIFHSQGEHFHQLTTAACSWGAMCLTSKLLRAYSRILTDEEIEAPSCGKVLRLAPGDRRRLLQLHAQAARIAETQPNTLAHPEVARALDQDLVWALVVALRNGRPSAELEESQRCGIIINRFEEELTGCANQVRVPEMCRALGVPTATLRACCSRILGMSASRYLLLHRRRGASRALRQTAPDPKTIAETTTR